MLDNENHFRYQGTMQSRSKMAVDDRVCVHSGCDKNFARRSLIIGIKDILSKEIKFVFF